MGLTPALMTSNWVGIDVVAVIVQSGPIDEIT
jgi:hypothetical protein